MDGADCGSFRRGRRRPAGECPGRGGERPLIPPETAIFGGRRGAKRTGGGYPPRIFQARRGAFFAQFTGAGSPPSASARPASRSLAAARARIPRMLRQEAGERGGDNPSNAGVFWGVERARRVRSGDYPPGHSRRVQRAVFARAGRQRPESARGRIPQRHGARGGALRPAQRNRESIFPPARPAFGGFGRMRRAGRVREGNLAELAEMLNARRGAAGGGAGKNAARICGTQCGIDSGAAPRTFPHGCGRIKSGIRQGGDSSSLQSPRKKDGAKADKIPHICKNPP